MENQSSKLDELIGNITPNEVFHISLSLLSVFIVIIVNKSGEIMKANNNFFQNLNYYREDLKGLKIERIVNEFTSASFLNTIKKDIKQKNFWTGNIMVIDKSYQKFATTAYMLNGENETYQLIISPINNINEHDTWRILAYTDELTGMPNRRKFAECMQYQMEKSKQLNTQFGVLFIDIDDFKKVNDQYGHSIGDKFLKECASRFTNVLEENQLVFRKSGDEFLIILEETDQIQYVVQAIENQFDQPFVINNHSINGTVSIGSSVFPKDGQTEESLIHRADRAMYTNKKKRKLLKELSI